MQASSPVYPETPPSGTQGRVDSGCEGKSKPGRRKVYSSPVVFVTRLDFPSSRIQKHRQDFNSPKKMEKDSGFIFERQVGSSENWFPAQLLPLSCHFPLLIESCGKEFYPAITISLIQKIQEMLKTHSWLRGTMGVRRTKRQALSRHLVLCFLCALICLLE